MTTSADIQDFIAQPKLALVGMSSRKKKFGNAVYRELIANGYEVFPVHPTADSIDGQSCWPSLSTLPEPVGGVVVVVPPDAVGRVVREAFEAGIRRVWLQQGAESPEAIHYGADNNISLIYGECILMFLESAAIVHRFHRWLWGVLGKLPK
jgi:predicted CoA-binding protein